MDSTAKAGSTELAEYSAMLRRRWWLVVTGALVGLGLATAALFLMPKTYVSTAVVQVMATGPGETPVAGRTNQTINLETEAQRIRSAEVATLVQKELKTSASPLELGRAVKVTVPSDSAVLVIDWPASSAEKARAGAQAFAQAYLKDRQDKALARLQKQAETLQLQINDLQEKAITASTAQRRVIGSQLTAFSGKLSEIRVSMANISGGEIITNAPLPEGPASPDPVKFLPSGLVGGLLLGILLAIVYDRMDPRVRGAGDVERVLDLPVMLDIPPHRGGEGLGLLPARSRSGQSFHELSHAITATLGHGNHVLLVTGAAPGRGASIVSANLAAALARTGSKVLLVSADLNASIAGELLGLDRGPGLSELLLGRAELREVFRKNHGLPTLATITAGTDGEMAAEMLQREQMAHLIEALRKQARFTVIEAPSTELGADAQALADLADAALVVVEVPRTRYNQVRDGVRRIHRMGAAVLGAVVLPNQDDKTVVAPPPTLPARHHHSAGDHAAAQNLVAGGTSRSPSSARSSTRREPTGYELDDSDLIGDAGKSEERTAASRGKHGALTDDEWQPSRGGSASGADDDWRPGRGKHGPGSNDEPPDASTMIIGKISDDLAAAFADDDGNPTDTLRDRDSKSNRP
ncbi:tyrosine-protein kinase domain-containing protein [Actinomadura rudentiformis]|uniref:Polysaccharide chain length determinant N-terminal domain-containing protein n=1 Tax=Actinomadura rudentiformis TaxID=359158 RepID=A0A6H9YVJ4_9ACTN|nr:tyrosine-protein kinase domain-containing protein [Actinomadura rudentiformis]KAB2344033.1 hypothetical protein F8566_32390 [Actinomadura rudentiformis]